MKLVFRFTLMLMGLLFLTGVYAQNEKASPSWSKIKDGFQLKTSLGFQLWSTYTMGQEVYEPESKSYLPVSNRWNNQIRRSRLAISGQPYEQLSFKLTAALDVVGRDANSATQGGNNNGSRGQFGLWEMYLRWKIFKDSDLAHLTFGYQLPQIGRESINGALRATSFEKSWSQNYLRRSIIGTGPGRVMGINVGGQKKFTSDIHVDYNIGIFTPQKLSPVANSQGVTNSPLIVSRVSIHLGDPENNNYTTSHKVNYFGKRNGLSIGFSNSYQGKTDAFQSNSALSFDFLWNWNMLQIDGEWSLLERTFAPKDASNTYFRSQTGYARIGYNFKIEDTYFIEPVIMWTQFNGMHDSSDYLLLSDSGLFTGNDRIIEFSLNYHFNPDLKLTLNYTMNQGEAIVDIPGFSENNFFKNSNKEAIRRGDLLAMGVLIIIK